MRNTYICCQIHTQIQKIVWMCAYAYINLSRISIIVQCSPYFSARVGELLFGTHSFLNIMKERTFSLFMLDTCAQQTFHSVRYQVIFISFTPFSCFSDVSREFLVSTILLRTRNLKTVTPLMPATPSNCRSSYYLKMTSHLLKTISFLSIQKYFQTFPESSLEIVREVIIVQMNLER